jgi:nucleoside-diphosphate-sugar epimerase
METLASGWDLITTGLAPESVHVMLIHQFAVAQKPARAVILGARGFISIALAQAFEKEEIAYQPVGSHEVDLLDSSAVEKLGVILKHDDVIIVTAALTPDKGRDVTTLMKNLRMAEPLCSVLARSSCAHVIYLSSDAVYDTRSSLINEQSSCEPLDLYSLMHIARERVLAHACQTAKIPFAAVRPCAVYGAGDTHNSYGPNRFIRTALADGSIRLFGEGEEQRDHIYVRDVAEIIKLCVVHRSAGVLNAASGKAVSFGDVARMIISTARRDVKLELQPRSSPITHRHFDITTLIRSFPGFQPTPLEAGIAASLAGMSTVI